MFFPARSYHIELLIPFVLTLLLLFFYVYFSLGKIDPVCEFL